MSGSIFKIRKIIDTHYLMTIEKAADDGYIVTVGDMHTHYRSITEAVTRIEKKLTTRKKKRNI